MKKVLFLFKNKYFVIYLEIVLPYFTKIKCIACFSRIWITFILIQFKFSCCIRKKVFFERVSTQKSHKKVKLKPRKVTEINYFPSIKQLQNAYKNSINKTCSMNWMHSIALHCSQQTTSIMQMQRNCTLHCQERKKKDFPFFSLLFFVFCCWCSFVWLLFCISILIETFFSVMIQT